jgi:cytidylate kinase
MMGGMTDSKHLCENGEFQMGRAIIAISNEYGTGGVGIGEEVARRLGYELVNEQVAFAVAQRLQISEQEAEAAEDTRRSVGERMLTSLGFGTPELAMPSLSAALEERYAAEVRSAVLEFAKLGCVVILGRGAGAILGRRPDVLRVFLHAPRRWRVEYVMQAHGADEKTTAAEVDRVDAARRAHVRDVYGVEFNDPHQYDLCLDVAQLGSDCSVTLIVDAARA